MVFYFIFYHLFFFSVHLPALSHVKKKFSTFCINKNCILKVNNMLMNTACSFCTRAVFFQNKPLLGIFHVNLIIRMKLNRFEHHIQIQPYSNGGVRIH